MTNDVTRSSRVRAYTASTAWLEETTIQPGKYVFSRPGCYWLVEAMTLLSGRNVIRLDLIAVDAHDIDPFDEAQPLPKPCKPYEYASSPRDSGPMTSTHSVP